MFCEVEFVPDDFDEDLRKTSGRTRFPPLCKIVLFGKVRVKPASVPAVTGTILTVLPDNILLPKGHSIAQTVQVDLSDRLETIFFVIYD